MALDFPFKPTSSQSRNIFILIKAMKEKKTLLSAQGRDLCLKNPQQAKM